MPGGIREGILEVSCELTSEGWVSVDRPRKILWSRPDCEQSTAMSDVRLGERRMKRELCVTPFIVFRKYLVPGAVGIG